MAQLRLAREPKCCLLLLHSVSKVHPQLQPMPREPFFLRKRSLKGHHIYCLQLDSTEVHYHSETDARPTSLAKNRFCKFKFQKLSIKFHSSYQHTNCNMRFLDCKLYSNWSSSSFFTLLKIPPFLSPSACPKLFTFLPPYHWNSARGLIGIERKYCKPQLCITLHYSL